jgi:tetratricopeptide (TPR) repeat protein
MFAQAIPEDSGAIAAAPDDSINWNDRCWDRAHAQAAAAALADCKQALVLAPTDPNILDSTGFAYLQLHEDAQSIASYDAALKIDPKFPSSLYGRGLAEAEMGEKAKAAADIAAAKAVDPGIESEM